MMQQLSSANQKISSLISDIEKMLKNSVKKRDPSDEDRLMKIAGVLDGWEVTASDLVTDIKLIEDEDMKRTREARKRNRW